MFDVFDVSGLGNLMGGGEAPRILDLDFSAPHTVEKTVYFGKECQCATRGITAFGRNKRNHRNHRITSTTVISISIEETANSQ